MYSKPDCVPVLVHRKCAVGILVFETTDAGFKLTPFSPSLSWLTAGLNQVDGTADAAFFVLEAMYEQPEGWPSNTDQLIPSSVIAVTATRTTNRCVSAYGFGCHVSPTG